MQWSDDAIVFGAKPFGETKALVEVFSPTQGRSAGVAHGGISRRMQPLLQAGNLVRVTWRARLGEQLGAFSQFELVEPYAARALNDPAALSGLQSAIALVRAASVERQPLPNLYHGLSILMEALGEPKVWPAVYVRFEIGLLAAAGYGLDLTHCALSGVESDLAYVSPKSGRAASREAGAPFADKLLILPTFLTDPEADLNPNDLADGFALSGFFLERRIFDHKGEGMPPARIRLIEALGRTGRL
jgi:DNA repair protein RecO (recombination protein O)